MNSERRKLSRREEAVAHMAADGGTNAAIAEELGVAVRTVGNHLYRAYAKLGIHNRGQLQALLGQPAVVPTQGASWPCKLSRREVQIARYAADGWTNAAIAKELEVSARTVGNHLRRIYQKLGVNSRRQLHPLLGQVTEPDGRRLSCSSPPTGPGAPG